MPSPIIKERASPLLASKECKDTQVMDPANDHDLVAGIRHENQLLLLLMIQKPFRLSALLLQKVAKSITAREVVMATVIRRMSIQVLSLKL
jgi:hypothetical protein